MITRFNGNVVPFAGDATSTNRTVFGGTTQSDLIDDNLNADFKKGWEIVGLNDNPTREDFNAMGYTLGALISYLYEMGISEWNSLQNYRINSLTTGSDGKTYKSLTGTIGSPNVGNNPITDTTNWKLETGGYVELTGDQTIAGIKTFTSFPVTPSSAPTLQYQVANKKYVDDGIAGIGSGISVGLIFAFAKNTAPTGYLECNGALVSRTVYASLFAEIGTTFGVGDGSTTFKIPDLRGEFIRGFDNARGIDSARVFGSAQTDSFKSHSHPMSVTTISNARTTTGTAGATQGLGNTDSTGGAETRPRNIALLYCIKY